MDFKKTFLFIACSLAFFSFSQGIKAKISIKEIDIYAKEKLFLGDFYFDPNQKAIVYHIQFPKESVLIFSDDQLFALQNDSVLIDGKELNMDNIFWSHIFWDFNNHTLLKKQGYTLKNSEIKDNYEVLTYQNQNYQIKKVLEKQQLVSIISLFENQRVDQIKFNQYVSVADYQIPMEILRLSLKENKQQKQWITLSEVQQNFNSQILDEWFQKIF